MSYNKKGYYKRAKEIQEIDRQHYQPYHSDCHKMVWRTHIRDQFGIEYPTFLKYLKVEVPEDV